MKSLNERNQVLDVVKNWTRQYGNSKDDKFTATGERLKELDLQTATADDVAAIIGNTSWVRPNSCDECDKETWDIVRLGEEPYYNSSTAHICLDCLQQAVKLAEGL